MPRPDLAMQIVRITAATAPVLELVMDDVFDDVIDPHRLEVFLASGQLLVVAVVDDWVVGQAQGMVQHHVDGPPQLYIDNLGVNPSLQRSGIATRLIAELIDWAQQSGCEETWIVTEQDNEAANALYRRLGADPSTVTMYSLSTRR